MNTNTETIDGTDDLDAILASIVPVDIDEIVETGSEVNFDDEDVIEAAVASVEAAEARQELYAEQDALTGPESEADAPSTPVEAIAGKSAEKPAKKDRALKAPKAPKEPKEPKAPKEPKPKLTTSKKAEVLKHRLGEKVSEYLVFDTSDLELDEAALQAKQEQFLTDLDDTLADKVGDKALMLFDWIAKGKGMAELNEVIRRGFNLLLADGFLTSGDKGNLQQDLLKKPYSLGTARSQANQLFCLFPALGITVKEKGRMTINENSVLLDIYRSRVGA